MRPVIVFGLRAAAKAPFRAIAGLFAQLTRPAPCQCRVLYRNAEGSTGAFDLRTAACADIGKLAGRHFTLIYGKGCYHQFRCPGFQAYWEGRGHPDIAWCEREVHPWGFLPQKRLREELLEGSPACKSCPFNKNWKAAEVCDGDHNPVAPPRADRSSGAT